MTSLTATPTLPDSSPIANEDSFMKGIASRRFTDRPGLFLIAMLSAATLQAADPAASSTDDAAKRLEAAADRAEAAVQKLESLVPNQPATAGPRADQAKAMIDRFLANLSPPGPAVGGFELNRTYLLTQDGDAYAARFPQAAWIQDGLRVEFGPMTLRVDPREGDQAAVEFRVGDTLTVSDGGSEVLRVLIGNQAIHGIWDEGLRGLAQGEARLEQLQLSVSDQALTASIGRIDLTQSLERRDDDSWNQRQTLTLADLQVQGEDLSLRLDQLAGQAGVGGRDYSTLLALSDEFNQLLEQQTDSGQFDQRHADLISQINDTLGHFDSKLIAGGLLLGAPGAELVTVEQINLATGFDAAETGSSLGYTLELDGMKSLVPVAPLELLPQRARLELVLKNIPPKLLNRILSIGVASEDIEDEEAREAYIGQQFLSLFMDSNLNLRIKNSRLEAPEARIELEAAAQVDPQTAFGASGQLLLRVQGLDRMMAATQDLEDEGAGQFLSMLLVMSQRSQHADGTVVDSFELKVSADGQLLLNGKDISALLMEPGMQEDPLVEPEAPGPES